MDVNPALKRLLSSFRRALFREAKGELTVVYPPISIRAEPHVAVVDANVDKKGTRAAAEAYLKFVDSDEGQEIEVSYPDYPHAEARDASGLRATSRFLDRAAA